MDVVTLRDRMVRVVRFSNFFTAVVGNKAGNKNQGCSELMEKVTDFSGSKIHSFAL